MRGPLYWAVYPRHHAQKQLNLVSVATMGPKPNRYSSKRHSANMRITRATYVQKIRQIRAGRRDDARVVGWFATSTVVHTLVPNVTVYWSFLRPFTTSIAAQDNPRICNSVQMSCFVSWRNGIGKWHVVTDARLRKTGRGVLTCSPKRCQTMMKKLLRRTMNSLLPMIATIRILT